LLRYCLFLYHLSVYPASKQVAIFTRQEPIMS
jgi:hypothetical protein